MILLLEYFFLALFIYGISTIHVHEETLAKRKLRYGGKHIFLTHIGINLTIIINLLNILGIQIYPLLLIFSMSLELTVTVLFYSLLISNERNLNVPDKTNKIIRNNHLKEISLHFLPFVYLINQKVDEICDLKKILLFGNMFFIFYILLITYYKKLNGEFCYPILNRLKFRGKMCLIVAGNILLNFCILIVTLIKNNS